MRLPAPAMPDPFFDLQGRRVVVTLDGRQIRGRLLSCRDGFVTLDPDRGSRITVNKYSIGSIQEDAPRVSRSPRLDRAFWR